MAPLRAYPALAALSLWTLPALAQASPPDSAPPPAATPPEPVLTRGGARLPVDRLADLLALLPGVNSLEQGDLAVRGAGGDAIAGYIDGVPFTPGRRGGRAPLLGGSWFGAAGSGIGTGTNGFESAALLSGASAAEFGSARGATLAVTTRTPSPDAGHGLAVGGSWATDAILGSRHGLGFNRVLLEAEAVRGRWSVVAAAALEGQSTSRLGLEQNRSPVYLANGTDTTVTVPTVSGPRRVEILEFRPASGVRIPTSATSSYTVLGRVSYRLGAGDLRLITLGSQSQARRFDYPNLYNPRQLGAARDRSRAITASWLGPIRERASSRIAAELHLSWQEDESVSGPLGTASESDSRNPFGGFLLAPLAFRFDRDNFALDDQLVRNFRTNSGRRSPYDLSNPTQYQLVDEWRNNAYGVTGFSESGGPVGLLTLQDETRLVAKGVLEVSAGQRHHGRLGAEVVRYDVRFYHSALTSQAVADAYVESPRREAVFGDYSFTEGQLRLEAGLRYDHFRTGASRPDFPRISSAPGFDPSRPTAGFVADRGHGRLSPRVRATVEATPRMTLFGGFAVRAQLPDFGLVLQGVNTDLGTTGSTYTFGSDLDLETSTLSEMGGRYQLDQATSLAATVWRREDRNLAQLEIVSRLDPLLLQSVDILHYLDHGALSATGIEAMARRQLGQRGEAWLSYTYVDQDRTLANAVQQLNPFPSTDVRPHTIAAAVLYEAGPEVGALGGLLRSTGVFGAVRVASGTGYTRCTVASTLDAGRISPATCSHTFVGDYAAARLPRIALVDLKVTRSFPVGSLWVTAFADARNLFNARNLIRAFVQTGKSRNSAERQLARQADLDGFSAEALQNGVYLGDSTIDLTFGGAADPRAGCGGWVAAAGVSAVPNCIYLLGAEQRFGNGDHRFTVAEQLRASEAYYNVLRGQQYFTGSGRRIRLGVELRL